VWFQQRPLVDLADLAASATWNTQAISSSHAAVADVRKDPPNWL
jgi:hypothetical protein